MRVLAIASAGGHWVQLLRLLPAFEKHEVTFISTNKSFAETVKGFDFYDVPDASRWNKLRLLYLLLCVARVVTKVKPQLIITTGAAPGLAGVIIGKVWGVKAIWIDSIANVEKISMSGRIAILFADKVYTQWPNLANSKVIYKGNVIV
ncbi:oligosaccharide biosynthesis protein Alg14 [uncultured Pontibacter sp.]|uniref:oligosaccharide biosynthesis protein Alg14 n=1 Tax=uncultured Pontibacter sp. TaxID=453356 RepID=UPI0026038A56|nr:oligosaccharide biosynthesis protein Alg14 [uncultured Pontibacter sp.]